MKLHQINQKEFNQIDLAKRIIVHDHPQKFARLELKNNFISYGINWRSDTIEPILALSKSQNTLWIGVDQALAAIDIYSGYIYVKMPLLMPLYQILIADNLTAILTEQEILLFSANHTLKCFHVLPELASKISVNNQLNFLIEMFDDSHLILTRDGMIKVKSYQLSVVN